MIIIMIIIMVIVIIIVIAIIAAKAAVMETITQGHLKKAAVMEIQAVQISLQMTMFLHKVVITQILKRNHQEIHLAVAL